MVGNLCRSLAIDEDTSPFYVLLYIIWRSLPPFNMMTKSVLVMCVCAFICDEEGACEFFERGLREGLLVVKRSPHMCLW